MPEIKKEITLNLTVEQYLEACSSDELQEIQRILKTNFFQARIENNPKRDIDKNQLIKFCTEYFEKRKAIIPETNDLEIWGFRYDNAYLDGFKKAFGEDKLYICKVFSRSFNETYPLRVAEKFLEFLKDRSIDNAYKDICLYIYVEHNNSIELDEYIENNNLNGK